MANINNPAGRLYLILEDAKKIAGKNQNMNVQNVWAQIFNVDKENLSLILKKLSRVLQLPHQIRIEINAQKNVDPQIPLKYFNQIEKILSTIQFNANMMSLLNQITEKELYSLEMCDDILSRVNPQIVIKDKDYYTIYASITELVNEVSKSQENSELNLFILSKLELILNAMSDYKVIGIEPIKEEITSIIGSVALKPTLVKDKTNKFQNKFWMIIGRLSIFVSIVSNINQLGPTVQNFIGGSGAEEAKIVEESTANSSTDNINASNEIFKENIVK